MRLAIVSALIYLTHAFATLSFRAENEGAEATESVVEKSRRCVLCHAGTRRSPQAAGATLWRRARLQGQSPGRNSLNQCSSAITVGISPLALSRFAPSWSVEMTDIGSSGEPNILMPLLIASASACQGPDHFCVESVPVHKFPQVSPDCGLGKPEINEKVCGAGLGIFAARARWRLPNTESIYSCRSAISGSTFVARRAGM